MPWFMKEPGFSFQTETNEGGTVLLLPLIKIALSVHFTDLMRIFVKSPLRSWKTQYRSGHHDCRVLDSM
jgi:hypothetical protein